MNEFADSECKQMNELERALLGKPQAELERERAHRNGEVKHYGGIIGTFVGLVMCVVGIAALSPRHGVVDNTWRVLNTQPRIECSEVEGCDKFEDIIGRYDSAITNASKKTNVPVEDIKALIAASTLHPEPWARMHTRGYHGTIPLRPEDAGVSPRILDTSLEQNIHSAAFRYRRLLDETDLPETAVASFFGNEVDIRHAKSRATTTFNKFIERTQFSNQQLLIKHRKYEQCMRDIAETDNEDEKEEILFFMRHAKLRELSPESLAKYEQQERESDWLNRLHDPYTRDAVRLFFAYKKNQLKK